MRIHVKNLALATAIFLLACLAPGAQTATQPAAKPAPLHDEILVPGGSFLMGYGDKFSKELTINGSIFSYDNVPVQFDEKLVHLVRLSPFWMMAHEVTQSMWIPLMGEQEHYRHGKGDLFPIYEISWFDAVEFANRLSKKDGLEPCYTKTAGIVACDFSKNGWRLPTEAEWEYAARSGPAQDSFNFAGSDDSTQVAAYYGTAGGFSNPVGKRKPNALGLFDMSGNVWEWCWDWYAEYHSGDQTDPRGPAEGENRVMRGGSWNYLMKYSRVTFRFGGVPDYYARDLGVRLVRNAN